MQKWKSDFRYFRNSKHTRTKGFLVTVDIEKAFDSVNHCFLLQFLQKFGFRIDFASWIKTV